MLIFIILFSLITRNVFSANILLISPVESVSHHIWTDVLVGGLLKKGHNLTSMQHMESKIKSENYTILRIKGFENIFEDAGASIYSSNVFLDLMDLWHYLSITSARIHLKSDALEILLNYPKNKFDLIIFDLVCGYELYPLIEHFGNPPIVGISPFSLPPYILDAMGSNFYYHYPFYSLPYMDYMTFLQRTMNTLMYLLDYCFKWYYLSRAYETAQARYGEDITPFDEMQKKIGILLANHDPILESAHPLPPNIIPVGGIQVTRSENLAHDLQLILDKANYGVIYFSFGTVIQPNWIRKETKQIFLNVFSRLNQTILWKYNGDDLRDVPGNVIIQKWYPQTDVLAHENVKLFITHSGSLSHQEAIYYGIPVLGIPFFADQKVTASKMEARKLGKQLVLYEITEYYLYETILEIINNPIYKQNIQRRSQLFRDQKESPLERAVFWIEYALRNKDLSHLSIAARDMTLFQRENLDVYGLILLCIIIVFISFALIVKYIIHRFIFKRKQKYKQH